MNKQNFRVIFNKHRGMLMAVAENVASQGKGAGAGSSATTLPLMRLVHLGVTIAALFGNVTFVQAQIVADPNAGSHRPTVGQTATSIPLVNIVAPNGAGVSHNQYNQFSVGSQGAILNNAPTSVQTQQAGWVPGNANLTPGNSARIILNEVTGTSRSQLNGYIEVAGQKAQVVIANVNGISCSGCGFINTSRGVLTTGVPVFGGDGSLQAFRVTRGDIQIDANGLNGNNLDQLDLIARSVSVNGQLWANNLNVIAGANAVNYADLGVQVITGEGGKPTVGIDSSALGGMYANKIKLVGTEAGVGVVSLGNIAAQAGDLNIDNQGKITLGGHTSATGSVRIVGNDGITNSGTLSGQQSMQLYSAGEIANSGTIAAQNDVLLFSGSINSTGVLGAGIDANGHATQPGSLSLIAAGAISATGQNTATNNVGANAGSSINLAHSNTNAGGNIGLAANAGNIDLTGGMLQAAGMANLSATGAVTNDQGSINAAQLTTTSASLSNIGGKLVQSGTGDTGITTSGLLDNGAGTISTNAQNVTIQSGSLNNAGGQISHAGSGTATIQSGATTNTQGSIASNGQINLRAASLNNQGGSLTSVQQTILSSTGDISNAHGTIQSGTGLTLSGANIDNSAGSIKSLNADGLTLTASGQLVNAAGGVIGGNGNANVSAGSLINSSTISAAQNLTIATTQALDNSSGTLAAGGVLNGSAGSALSNNAGTIAAAQINLHAHDIANQSGVISQSDTAAMALQTVGAFDNTHGTVQSNANDLTLTTGGLINDNGTISQAAAGALKIASGALSNQHGTIVTNGAASITAGAATNSGTISAQQTLDLSAASLNNNTGTLASNGAMHVNAGSTLTNSGGTIQAGSNASPSSATITAATLDNSNGTLGAGSIDLEASTLVNAGGKIIQGDSNGVATVNVSQLLNNDQGMIGIVARNLTLAPGALQNNGGTIAHTGSGALTVQTGALSNNGGVLGTNGAATVTASSIVNQGGKLTAVGNESVTSGAGIDNSQGGYIGGAAVAVNATGGLINNQGGTMEGATAGATVNAQSLNNAGGKVQNLGTGAVAVNVAQALNNAAGSISGKSNVTTTAGSINNVGGAIGALGDLTVSSGSTLDNSNGAMEAMGNVTTTAQGALSNIGGKIEALGSSGQLQVSGNTLDNTSGKIINVGSGQTTVTGTMAITNANPSAVTGSGLIGGAGDVTIATPTLSNTQGAQIIAGRALNLDTATSLNNNGGQLIAANALTLNQAGAALTNVGGDISGGSVVLTTTSIDNTAGKIANQSGSGGGIAITTGTFTNINGAVGSDVDLSLTATTLAGDGKVVAGRDGNVSLQGDYTYDAANQITANRNLTLSSTGTLTNTGTLAATGNLTVNAANVVNAAGADIASGNPGDLTTGTTTINTGSGNITNVGRLEGNNVNTTSNQLNNTGTVIGNNVTVNAGTVTNDGAAAIIAGVNQVNLWVTGSINNQNGATLYSLGDLNMAANGAKDANGYLFNQTGTINNLSSTIEADGTLNVAANQINNVRQNVQTNTVTLSDTTTTMGTPAWWSSLRPSPSFGGGDPLRNSNTRIRDAYYVDPSQIVSSTPIVTPDGVLLYKVVVNLKSTDSAFEYLQSDLTYALPNGGADIKIGGQSRVTPTAGTQTLYVTAIANNQANPDQVANGDAWSQFSNNVIRNTVSSIAYSNQYGSCTANCVRLQTYKDYTDPSAVIGADTMRTQADNPGGYPVEVQRIAHQVVTETQLASTTGAPAKITSGGAMHMAIGTQLNNDNGQIAAGSNLTIDGVASADGSNNTKIVNTATQLTRTYTSDNQSGFGSADRDGSTPVQWSSWSATPITQNIGVAGGTITSNQAVTISGGKITNTSVGASTRPVGSSAASLGLGDGIAPLDLASNAPIGGVPAGNQTGVAGTTPVGSTGSTATPGAARTVDGARAGAVNTVLPTNGLYSVRPQPNQPYLIATDPRFTQYGNFISSDYMLGLLGINPAVTQKRLGDGFYEEKLVTDQVTNLTGMRYLNGYANAEEEYKSLMTNGAQYAKQFNMVPGIALSDAQMAALTTNIVWLVNQTVTLPDGSQQTVLVPQVYLAKNMDLTPTGALIAGNSVAIQGTDITNSGGTMSGKQQLLLAADHDISNIGGTLAGGNVGLFAGNNILDQSVTNTTITNFGNNSSTITAVGAVGKIAATQNLVMSAGQNLTLQGAQVSASGNAMLTAGNAINVETVTTGSHYVMPVGNTHTDAQSTHAVGSTVAAGGNLGVVSGGDMTVTGSNLSSGKDMLVAAGGNVKIQNATDSSSYHTDGSSKDGSQTIDQHNQSAIGSTLIAGGNATVLAGAQQDAFGNTVLVKGAPAKDITLTASAISAGANQDGKGNAILGATGNVTVAETMLHNDFSQEDKSSHKGFLSSSSSHDVQTMSGNVAQGSTVSGNQVSVTAGNDVTVRGSNVIGVNDVSLTANNGKVAIVSAQNTSQTDSSHEQKKSGFTAGFSGGVASIGYGKGSASSQNSVETLTQQGSSIASINGNTRIQAGQALSVVASDISAGQNLTLIGKSVDLSAAQNTSVEHGAQQSSSSGISLGLTLNPVAAFKSAYQQSASGNPSTSILGKSTKYGDAIGDGTLAASTPVVVQAGSHSSSGNQDHATSTAQVSSLTAGNNLTVLATGGSITSQGTNMSSGGDAMLIAKDNINLDVAHSFESQGQTNASKGWSLDNRGSLPAGVFNGKGNGNGSTDTVTGTTLSAGGKATLATTDGDINLTASNLVATSDLSINAARNLTIQSGQNTATNANQNNTQAIGKVVISDTERFAGYSADKSKNNDTSVTQVASNVGSLQGNVNLSAGEKYTQTASNVLAAQDINIVAKSIDINTAANTGNSDQSTSDLKVGAFARVTSPLIDLGNNLENAKKSDGRLQAMQGLAAVSNGYQVASAASAALKEGGSGELLKAEVGVGFTTANSQDRSNYSQAQGSSIQGGGNVNLTSTEGDIHATGAHIAAGDAAGKTLTLDSARNILLDAGQSTATSSGSNHSAGVEVGVGYEVGAQTGAYAYVTANVGNGNYNNTATTNSNTQLSGNTVTLKSKGDTTLAGATVKADTINADVGGALAITSVQDTATQHNEQNSVGGRVQISFGTAWEASGNLSQSNANGTSNAVNQQSGLFAGNGGYHVTADAVALKGGAIASTNAGKSDLTANSLTVENITNKMDYSADSASISGGMSGSLGGSGSGKAPTQTSTGASNPNVTPGIPLLESGSAGSTTYGTLTDGNINIGGQHMTSAAGMGAHTDLATANAAIAPLPDLKNVMNNQQAMAAAANTVITTSNQIANDIGAAANKKNEQAQAVLHNPDSTQAQKEQAQQDAKDAQATLKNWGPTGDYTRDLKVVTAILVGGVAGQGAGQLAANASAPFAAQAIGDYFAQPGHENQTAQVLTHAVLGGILAAANGASAAAGAGAGAAGELAAQEITRQLYPDAYDANGTFHPEKLDAGQIQTVIGLSTAIGALVAGATGGSLLDANVGANIAQNAVTNNWLSKKEKQKEKELSAACFVSKSADACQQLGNLQAEDDRRNQELVKANAALKEISGEPAQNLANQLLIVEGKICTAPSDCSKNPDWLAVDQVRHYAMQRSDGLQGVYPEQWALVALGALDLTIAGVNGIKYLATEQFVSSGSKIVMGGGGISVPDLVKAANSATGIDSVWHATRTTGAASGILGSGIDPAFLNANSRFGSAFYVAEQPSTSLAEMAHYGVEPTTGIRFSVNQNSLKVLDLTNSDTAAAWGYKGGSISSTTQQIGTDALAQGYNAIRYGSERATGGTNLAILNNFNQILKPIMVTPAVP
ncbi:hemagluttinin repeat family protein [Collimonas fungivorans]|uniref:Hemagluttinin repeat family protein n=1 Tax=Collimonas fungivorans TaxID=158899 RepID=A0A127P8C6_9BURK|nr:hemagglutinin repeat-containing protein [Collimonas fungivorans]AMO94017.1 hemagluttinin repeat family protein [Collimonas fungivorans]